MRRKKLLISVNICSTFCIILFSSTKKFGDILLKYFENNSPTYILIYVLEQLLSHPWVVGDKAKDDAMDPEIVSRLQSFNARRKLRAAAIASVWSTAIFLRTKKLKSLVGTHDLTEEEIENLRMSFKKM